NALSLLATVTWGERAGILLGHLAYGAALGGLYTRPAGYPAGPPLPPRCRPVPARREPRVEPRGPFAFIFASGIEGSYPRLEAGRWRLDEMAATGHERRWAQDLALAVELGLTHLRWGPPLHLAYPARGRFDWSLSD